MDHFLELLLLCAPSWPLSRTGNVLPFQPGIKLARGMSPLLHPVCSPALAVPGSCLCPPRLWKEELGYLGLRLQTEAC
jgi:hypothetical protein